MVNLCLDSIIIPSLLLSIIDSSDRITSCNTRGKHGFNGSSHIMDLLKLSRYNCLYVFQRQNGQALRLGWGYFHLSIYIYISFIWSFDQDTIQCRMATVKAILHTNRLMDSILFNIQTILGSVVFLIHIELPGFIRWQFTWMLTNDCLKCRVIYSTRRNRNRSILNLNFLKNELLPTWHI